MISCLKESTDFLYAWSLDDKFKYSTRDGYSAFNALAGFAVAQGVALTAVAKGEGRTLLVLSIYFVAACLTIWWTARLLRAQRIEAIAGGSATTVRAFDHPSIQHGRFTLTWILVVAVVLIVLANLGLLPNQTAREYYSGDIKLSSSFFEQRTTERFVGIEGAKADRQVLDLWLTWIQPVPATAPATEKLVWLQQVQPFPAHQKSLNVELQYSADVVVTKRVAFLVKADGESIRPVLRQMRFDLAPRTFDQTDRLVLVDPDPGETLVIMCLVDAKPGKTIATIGDCGFSIARK